MSENGIVEMLSRDHKRMRDAGTELAEAALRVIREYDGLHRLSLAVAKWAQAIADEGDRPHRTKNERENRSSQSENHEGEVT